MQSYWFVSYVFWFNAIVLQVQPLLHMKSDKPVLFGEVQWELIKNLNISFNLVLDHESWFDGCPVGLWYIFDLNIFYFNIDIWYCMK